MKSVFAALHCIGLYSTQLLIYTLNVAFVSLYSVESYLLFLFLYILVPTPFCLYPFISIICSSCIISHSSFLNFNFTHAPFHRSPAQNGLTHFPCNIFSAIFFCIHFTLMASCFFHITVKHFFIPLTLS